MANTNVFRVNGPTTCIAVTSASSTALTCTPLGRDQINYAGLLNTNSFPVAVTIAPTSAGAAVLPTAGNTSTSIILGVSMPAPMVVAVPPNEFSITAISSGANTGSIYVTPMADQS
jgi:hypothetical protein